MKKILLSIICLALWITSYSQQFGLSMGLTSKLYLPFDIHYATINGFGLKFNFSLDLNPGTKGENYSSTINWDQFPEDHLNQGSYYTTYDLGLGKYFENFYLLGLLGIAKETKYRNCFDDFHILGNNGYYYKQIIGKSDINLGGEIGLIINNFLIGLHATIYSGIGLKIGYKLEF